MVTPLSRHSHLFDFFPNFPKNQKLISQKRVKKEEIGLYVDIFLEKEKDSKRKISTISSLGITPPSEVYYIDEEFFVAYDDLTIYILILTNKYEGIKFFDYMIRVLLMEEKLLPFRFCFYFLAQSEYFYLEFDDALLDQFSFFLEQERRWRKKYKKILKKEVPFSSSKFYGIHCPVEGPYPDDGKPFQVMFSSLPPKMGPTNRGWVHASYTINLARKGKAVQLLKEFIATTCLGYQGLTVHVGSYVELTPEDAVNNMTDNIRNFYHNLPDKIKGCKTILMLETGPGEKTDLFSSPYMLYRYVSNLRKEIDERIFICFDTCHVFSAGFDPEETLHDIVDLVRLIHYNDSLRPLGSCRDLHSIPGTGEIGYDVMMRILEFATEMSIPLIYE